MKLIKKILFFIFLLTSLLSPAKSHKDKMLKKVFPTLASTMKIQIITKDTLFYNNKWELTTKEDAEFFRPLNFEKKGNLWLIKDYYSTGEVQYEAYSSSKTEEILEGIATWYLKDGTINHQTTFIANKETSENSLEKIEIAKIYNEFAIEKIPRETLISKNYGYVLKDTVPDYAILLRDQSNDLASKRLIIQINTDDGIYLQETFKFDKNDHLETAYFAKNQLILEFIDTRRLTNWQRTLSFKLEEQDTKNIEAIEAYYTPNLILTEDKGVANYPLYNETVSLKKNNTDFGSISLSNLKFKDTTDNYTYNTLQKTTHYQDQFYKDDDQDFNLVYAFLDSIKDNKTIHIKKGVYNFSKIQYSNVVSEGKKVSVNSGSLQITGYSNINFIAEEGVYFVSNDQFLDVVAFTYCKNIEVNNVMALHNVKETYCHAPVFDISNCTYLTFDYCIADGSGRYGFHITTNSESIKIVNTTITNCSTSAIYARNSSILMDNVLITKNTLSSSIFDLDNVKISMKNSAIKENTINYQEYFQVQNSSLKMTNVFMDIKLSPNNFHGVLFHNNTTAEVILKNSTIKIENGINLYSVVPLTLIDTKISVN